MASASVSTRYARYKGSRHEEVVTDDTRRFGAFELFGIASQVSRRIGDSGTSEPVREIVGYGDI